MASSDEGFNTLWLDAINETVASYRRLIDASLEQLSHEELFARPSEELNSVATILRHLGGNLRSRWTNYLTSDGEKPDRDRDREFEDWDGDRMSLLRYFDEGWSALTTAIDTIDASNVSTEIYIRGEAHSVPQAVARSVTHIAYHTGQIAMIARTVHQGEWKWLTVRPGGSQEHNAKYWRSTASRGAMGGSADEL